MRDNFRAWPALAIMLFALPLLAACGLFTSDPDSTATVTLAPPPTQSVSATPLPNASVEQLPTPPLPTGSPTTASLPVATPTPAGEQFLPIAIGPPATATPTASPTPLPTPTPVIDFTAVRAELNSQGQELGFAKIGFHVGPGGNRDGLGEWMRRLDAAGVPFFLKSVDDAGPLLEGLRLAEQSGVPHTLVYRTTGDHLDVPDYSLPAAEAARRHWEVHKAAFPPELDPGRVWLETINEVDANRSEWLAQFALATAQMAMADGFNWAAFGWASGEPEPADWESPAMLQFLRLAAANPDRLAIALHEYSYTVNEIGHEYPYKVGRFQQLFEVADRHGLPRPTVLITEWGWEYQNVPPVDQAMADIVWAANLYAPYPEIRGAAIWYLGPGFADIADQTQRLIGPVTDYTLGNYFVIPLPPEIAPIEPERYSP
jgi:hypothetical protein